MTTPLHPADAQQQEITDHDKFVACMSELAVIKGYVGAALKLKDLDSRTQIMLTTIQRHAIKGLVDSGIHIEMSALQGMGCETK
jgi:hypothetical protein